MEPSWASKTEPRRSKIDVEKASKFDQFLKASWKAIFSAQEAPRRENAADRRRRWSRPGPGGGGFRRGKSGPQAPRTFESRIGGKSRRPGWKSRTPTPVGRRIEAPQGGVPPPNVFGVWSVAVRQVVRRNKALRFEFSGRRSYGFCSRLCPRQVLGFSALSSAGSWIF